MSSNKLNSRNPVCMFININKFALFRNSNKLSIFSNFIGKVMQLKVITHPAKARKNSRFWRIYLYIQGTREQKVITPWHFQYLSPPAPPCSPKETFETLTKIITCETMAPTGVLFRKFGKSRQHMEKICKATLSCNNNSIRILTSVKCDFFVTQWHIEIWYFCFVFFFSAGSI